MDLFVSFILFIMYMFLLPGVRGQCPNKIYSKLTGNIADQLYVQLLKTDHVRSRQMCAMACSQSEMCTLFQFKDEICKLLKQEAGPGSGIISLTGMTAVWRIYIGKATISKLDHLHKKPLQHMNYKCCL